VLFFLLVVFVYCRGAFSIVKKAISKTSKIEYAAKIINTRRLTVRGKR